jgi:XTP/dITP diphosphohydrolase
MFEIVAATKNVGKVRELKELFADLPLQLKSLNEFPNVFEPEETGATFAENAVIKARSYALQTQSWSLADDSGLEVDALGGAPGVFSARYAGENASDQERLAKLLHELDKTQDRKRLARFVCAMAVSDEKGEIKILSEGVCTGKITLKPAGTNGFGYDPIFMPAGFEQTFGELSSEIKQKISHRVQAAEKIIAFLQGFYAASLDQQVFRL